MFSEVASFPERLFDERMSFLGFRRPLTQLNTPGDGSCFNWAVLNSHNDQMKENSKFPKDNPVMFRFEFLILNTNYFIYSRTHVVMELWSQMVTEGPGGIISSAMTAVLGSPENYVKKMRNHVEHVDQLFISMAACVLGQDIIILHLHNDTCSNGMYVLHPGGSFNSGERSQENPIFVAYYEETRFFSGHYQAVEPVSNGPVLKDLLAKGGRDIAGILSLPEQSN